jgi:ABC-2 type transport system permease protein
MGLNLSVVKAVFWRNFASYFANPVGYLFIFAFTLAAAYFAFNDQFFAANMADLEQLNAVFSLLALLLVPAITMSAWAEERRSGTEELLLTLPGSDLSIVLGKYFACVGIYTAALGFSIVMIFLLGYLGSPDVGLLFSTYLGYWFIGACLISAGMVASLLTSHTTVAFILGMLICGILVGVARIGDVFTYMANLFASIGWIKGAEPGAAGGGFVKEFLPRLSVEGSFQYAFGRGVMTVSSLWYFVAVTIVMLYLNVFLLGRRHWGGGEKAPRQWTHGLVRTVAMLVAAVSLYVFARRADAVAFIDATSERLHALSKETVDVLKNIPEDRVVRIDAFLSPVKDLPKDYVEVHRNLRDKLLQYEAQGRGRIVLNIEETELFSPAAARAEKSFNIKAVKIPVQEEGRFRTAEFILGIAVRSGKTEMSIPFFYKGLPVEYELTRLVRTASAKELTQIAVLGTEADILDRFNQDDNDWLIVNDLKKQYKVIRAAPGQLFQREEKPAAEKDAPPLPKDKPLKRDANGEPLVSDSLKDVKCLIVPMPSSLKPDEMTDLVEWIKAGKPTLILEDAVAVAKPQLTSNNPMMRGGMMGQPPPSTRDVAALGRLASMLGIEFDTTQVVWQSANPLRQKYQELPLEYLPSGKGVSSEVLHDPDHPITSSMRDYVLFLFSGGIKKRGGDGPDVKALLRTTREAGTVPADSIHDAITMGAERDYTNKRVRRNEEFILAAAITGKPVEEPASPDAKKDDKKLPAKDVKVVWIADLDFISNNLFNLRRSGERELDFENVGFLVNCVDFLAGDESLIALRQKRPQRRTLTRIMQLSEAFDAEAEKDRKAAQEKAQAAEDAAQKRFNEVENQLKGKQSINLQELVDVQQKLSAEQQRLNLIKAEIAQERNDRIRDSQLKTQERLRQQQLAIRFLAIMLPAIPVLLLGLVVWSIRSSRETEGVQQERLR